MDTIDESRRDALPAGDRATVAELMAMLGGHATGEQAAELWAALGPPDREGRVALPDGWRWIMTGDGRPPPAAGGMEGATSLLGAFLDLPEDGRRALLGVARRL